MKYEIRSNNQRSYTRNVRSIPEPILDLSKETVAKDTLNIQKNCGPDNICIPDLRLQIK